MPYPSGLCHVKPSVSPVCLYLSLLFLVSLSHILRLLLFLPLSCLPVSLPAIVSLPLSHSPSLFPRFLSYLPFFLICFLSSCP